MKDEGKTKAQLLDTVSELRRRVSQLEQSGKGRKQAREALQKSEIDYRSIYDSVNDMIVIHDAKTGRPLDVNKKVVEAFGWSQEEFLDLTVEEWSEGKPPFSQKEAMQNIKKASAGKPQLFEWRCKDKKGRLFWVEVNLKLADNEGKNCVLAVVRDITERKRIEGKLEQKMREMETFINNIPHMAWLKDPDSNFIIANQAFGDTVGMSQEYLKSNTCAVCFGEKAAKKFKADDKRVIKGKKQITLEETIVDKDGKEIFLETTKSPIFNDSGNVVGTVGIAIGITERKKTKEALLESEDRYKASFDNSSDAINIFSADKKILAVNNKLIELSGFSKEELLSMKLPDLYPEAASSATRERIEMLKQGKELPVFGNYILTKKKKKVPVEIGVTILKNCYGEEVVFQGNIRDITDRKRTEEELDKYRHQLEELVEERTGELVKTNEQLKKSEEKYREIFESVGEVIAYIDRYGKVIDVNKKIMDVLGYSRSEVIGKNFAELNIFKLKNLPEIVKHFKKAVKEEKTISLIEIELKHKKGHTIFVEVKSTQIKKDGKIEGFLSILHDITERKQAESQREAALKSLQESEGKFRSILKSMDDLVFVLDKHNRYVSYYAPENKLYVKPDAFLGKKHSDVMPADMDKLFTNALTEVKKNKTAEYEYQLEVPDGLHWYNMKLSPIMEGDEYSGLVAVARDITERKKTEEALQESEQKLRNLFESVSEGIFTMDLNGTYTEVNKRVLEMYGLKSTEKVIGKSGFQFVAPNDIEKARDGMKKVMEGGAVVHQEFGALRPDGSEFTIEVTGTLLKDESGNPIGITGVARDITERKRVEEGLRNAERLESLGFLAGGIAHDFNNLLSGIFGNIELAMINSSSEEKVLKSLKLAIHAMARAKDLTNQLLTFASGGAPVMKLIAIEDALKESVSFALSGSNINPSFSIDQDIWPVEADQGQINQVINNILLNARQAMPEGGTIEIKAANARLKSKQILQLQKGMYIKIAIKDHGIGMPRDILEKIFDPFFTTKQAGSGLGLSICYSIVKKHNGHITVDSRPGAGSVFTLYLPATEKEILSEPEKQFEILKGKGKILIMDDESIVCEMLIGELDLLGYEVEVTYNGDEAVKVYEEAFKSGNKFDAVILDLTIPGGKGGKEAITELRNIDPDIKAVVSSGYSDNPVIANPEEYGFRSAIQKPFMIEALSQVLYDLLTDKKNSKD